MHSDPSEADRLAEIETRFMGALRLKDAGELDRAEDEFRAILKVEPRLAEVHMELGRVLLDTDRISEAESHAREGLRYLDNGGQWTDEVPENVLTALACALLAEVLRRRADEDDVIFGDPDDFHKMVAESKSLFDRAAQLDSSDDYSSYYAFFMGKPGVVLEP